MVPIHHIKPDPNNPNKMTDAQTKALKYSMEKFDDVMPIVIDSKTMIVADGHHRLAVYKAQGVEEIPVIKKEFKNDAERILFGQTMNKLRGQHDKAMDIDVVYSLVHDNEEALLEYMRLTAIEDERQVFEYLKKQYPDFQLGSARPEDEEKLSGLLDPNKLLNINEQEIITKKGDLWKLGNHFLLCGDCTNPDDVETLLQGNQVDLLLTDPPYGVNYSGKNEFLNAYDKGNRVQTPIEGDENSENIDDYLIFFSDFLKIIPFADYNIFYISILGSALHVLRQAIDMTGLTWSDYLIWVKNNHVLGRKDYNAKHEFVVYGWKNHHQFYGDFNTTILNFDKPSSSKLHPTMKPIELLTKLIYDGSKKDMIVYDPFLGSGSTMIACQQTQRICYGMEINRKYCDVICERFFNYTRMDPERVSDGKTFSQLQRERQRLKNKHKEEREESD